MTRTMPTSSAQAVGPRYASRSVDVDGGPMRVGVWEPAAGPAAASVLLIHGITASHLSWPAVARLLPECRVLAPDLRGRGESRDLPGPYGMPAHADDMAAVIRDLAVGGEPLRVVGHSMGGFVAMVLADRHPDLVRDVLLVDGGLPLLPPPGFTPDQLAAAVLGPAAERLAMTFASPEAYRDFWRPHPAFARGWTPDLEGYIDYDLVRDGDALRPATRVEAMQGDVQELTGSEALLGAWERRRRPTSMLVAPRGLLDEVPPLYPAPALARWRETYPDLPIDEVDGVNHYTVTMSERGAAVVAARIGGDAGGAGDDPGRP